MVFHVLYTWHIIANKWLFNESQVIQIYAAIKQSPLVFLCQVVITRVFLIYTKMYSSLFVWLHEIPLLFLSMVCYKNSRNWVKFVLSILSITWKMRHMIEELFSCKVPWILLFYLLYCLRVVIFANRLLFFS